MNDDIIFGFFNELEKIGASPTELLLRGVTSVAGKAIQHPGAAYWRYKQQSKGLSRHKQTMLALKHGYPAGWVNLGMRPG